VGNAGAGAADLRYTGLLLARRAQASRRADPRCTRLKTDNEEILTAEAAEIAEKTRFWVTASTPNQFLGCPLRARR
jgi:hypothetical protein